MTPIAPDESLYAFLDGELEIHNEQALFDELASRPELRTEMKDLLSIRSAVHRDVMFPSSAVETGILASTGFISSAPLGTAAVVASTSAFGSLTSLLHTGMGIAVGALIMFATINTLPPTQELAVQHNSSFSAAPVNQAVTGPVAPIVISDTVYRRKVVVISEEVPATPRPVLAQVSEPVEPTETTSVAELSHSESVLVAAYSPVQVSSFSGTEALAIAKPISAGSVAPNVVIGVRTLASGNSSTLPTPESVRSAILPNTAFAFMMPLAPDHHLGVEMGTESFTQRFQGTDGVKQAEWLQTPVLFWIGATYRFTANEWSILPGLAPFTQFTLGAAFAQGPIGRGTVGLTYQPAGPVRMSIGIDGSSLLYSFQYSLFTTSKWGISYGLGIDLGSRR